MGAQGRDTKQSGLQGGEALKLSKIAKLELEIERLKQIRSERAANDGNGNGDGHDNGHKSNGIEHHPLSSDAVDMQIFADKNVLPMFHSDCEGNIWNCNQAMEALLGYTKEELISGKISWIDLTPPELLVDDAEAIKQIKATARAKPWEKQYICKDGTHKSVLLGVVATDTTGHDCFIFVLDLTDRKRMEAEIRESEQRFRSLAEALPQIVWMADPFGCTTYHNRKFYDYTGVRVEDDNGFAWLEHVHPDDREGFKKRTEAARKSASGFQYEYRYRSRTGEYRWYLCMGLPILDEFGKFASFFGTCTDIDDQLQLEQELRESEIRFRTLANAIPQIVWTANPSGVVDFFNDRWFEYTGLTYEQGRNNGWELLIHPEDLERYKEGWKYALKTGDSYEVEFRLKRAVGLGKRVTHPYRWHLCRAVALRDHENRVVKWFATWTEIEDQKRNAAKNN